MAEEFKRRAFMADAGEPLLVAPDPCEAVMRLQMWLTATQMDPDNVLVSPLCSVPVPLYLDSPVDGHRWASVDPSTMWHPLFWLPPRIAGRYSYPGAENEPDEHEDDETWLVRLALELSASGLYDQATGTWLDVLALAGLDADAPADQERVQRWLDGEPDEALDGIDLSEYTESPVDPHWALEAAVDQLVGVQIIAWALNSESLLESCRDLISERDSAELETSVNVAAMLAALAAESFNSFPETIDDAAGDDGEELVDHTDAEHDWWTAVAGSVKQAATSDELFVEYVPAMMERLTKISADFLPLAEAFARREEQELEPIA